MDPFTNLPDNPVEIIITALDTRNAAKAGMVSKHFRRIWLNLSVLNIDFEEFLQLPTHLVNPEEDITLADVIKFEGYTDFILKKRKPGTVKSINYKPKSDWQTSSHIQRSLISIVCLKPKVIDIEMTLTLACNSSIIPKNIFSSTELESISFSVFTTGFHLHREVYLDLFPVSLPNLKFLMLHGFTAGDVFINNVFKHSNRLKTLHLSESNLSVSTICSSALEHLQISDCYQTVKLDVSTPGLKTLSLGCGSWGVLDVVLHDMPILESFHMLRSQVVFPDFLGSVCHATSIIVGMGADNFWEGVLQKFRTSHFSFENLTFLKLRAPRAGKHFFVISRFLRASPKLKELEVIFESDIRIQEYKETPLVDDVPFQCEFVETVRITSRKEWKPYILLRLNEVINEIGKIIYRIGY